MPGNEVPGKVSVWVGQERHPLTVEILKKICKADNYDTDFQECIIAEDWQPQSISELVRQVSYHDSFASDLLAASQSKGIDNGLWLIAQFEYEFTPPKMQTTEPVFLGTFAWSEQGETLT